jgi:hypothetical protein
LASPTLPFWPPREGEQLADLPHELPAHRQVSH